MAQLSLTKVEIERNDLLEEEEFTLEASGKAFRILSDGLYKDKIRAIIRELSCNAWDAHVAAGKPEVPFNIHLPNYLEPHFTIRDFGTGLSKEDCKYLITRYFKSTKTTSNDFIGALGLGAKSPFSYVDSYTIVSYFNGDKFTFSAFIGEDERPKIAMMGEEKTSEPNGLEISMPVRSVDYNTFAQRAADVLKRFNPVPTITGNTIEITNDKVVLSGEGWRFLESKNYRRYGYSEGGAVAIMGKIAYPISVEALRGRLTNMQEILLSYPIEIDFEIGSLEFASSREELSYKPGTIESIKKRLDELLVELPVKFQHEFDKVTTLWEARVQYAELQSSNTGITNLINDLRSNNLLAFTALGQIIDSSQVKVPYDQYPGLVLRVWYHYHAQCAVTDFDAKAQQFKNQSNNALCKSFNVDAGSGMIWFTHNTKTGPSTRLRAFAKNRRTGAVVLVEGNEASVKKFLNDIGNPPVHETSELPVPPRAKSQKVKARVWHRDHEYWKDSNEIDLSDDVPGLYLYYARDNAHTGTGYDFRHGEFAAFVKLLTEFKLIKEDTPIVGLNLKDFEKMKANTDTKWQHFGPYLKAKFEATYMQDSPFLVKVIQNCLFSNVIRTHYWKEVFNEMVKLKEKIDTNSPLVEFITRWQAAAEEAKDPAIPSFSRLANYFGVDLASKKENAYDFEMNMAQIKNRYPIMQFFDLYRVQRNVGTFIDYVNLVESSLRSGK